MFGVSFPELLVIMLVVLVVFGPDKLPEIARGMGRLFGELRKNTDQVRREFYNSVYTPANDLRDRVGGELRSLATFEETRTSTPFQTSPLKAAPSSDCSTDSAGKPAPAPAASNANNVDTPENKTGGEATSPRSGDQAKGDDDRN